MRLKSFSLLEVMLSIGIVVIISGIYIPVYLSYQHRNGLDIAVNSTVGTLRRAQSLARAVTGDRSWGVKIQNQQVTLFRGTSYALREPALDENINLPTNVTATTNEVVFSKFTGRAAGTGTTITLVTSDNEQKNVNVNQEGTVNY